MNTYSDAAPFLDNGTEYVSFAYYMIYLTSRLIIETIYIILIKRVQTYVFNLGLLPSVLLVYLKTWPITYLGGTLLQTLDKTFESPSVNLLSPNF